MYPGQEVRAGAPVRYPVEGASIYAIKATFEQERIPTPGGGKHWDRSFFRNCILDDVYKPHTFEEVAELVTPEVAARLDRTGLYGVWWFNRRRVQTRRVSEVSENGRRYRTESRRTRKPKDDWIAVPVPDSGIPREIVEAARTVIKDNRVPSKAGRRFWELSGGIIRCGVCSGGTAGLYRERLRGEGLTIRTEDDDEEDQAADAG